MTEQKQVSLEEIIQAKLEADEKIIDDIQDEVKAAFPDSPRIAELISNLAVKSYHNSTEIEEMHVQEMYISTAVDALIKILVHDKKIITEAELRTAVEEAHELSKAAIEEANQIYATKLGLDQDSEQQILTI